MSGQTLRKFLFPRRAAHANSAAVRSAGTPSRQNAGALAPRLRRGDVTTFHRCLALHMVCAERAGALR